MAEWINKIIQKFMFPTRRFLNRKFRENEENLGAQIQGIKENIKAMNNAVECLKNTMENLCMTVNNINDNFRSELSNFNEILRRGENNAKENFHTLIDMQTKEMHARDDLMKAVSQMEKQSVLNRDECIVKVSKLLIDMQANEMSAHNDLVGAVRQMERQGEIDRDELLLKIGELIKNMQAEGMSAHNDLVNAVRRIEEQSAVTGDELTVKIHELDQKVCENVEEYHKQSELQSKNQQNISEIKTEMKTEFKSLLGDLRQTNNIIEETNWAQIFHDTITDSEWLVNKTFSPGRWAAGYQMLYVIYRILNEVHPKDILELGLGQSTKLIMQYSQYYKANHTVTEHDAAWIEACKENFSIPEHVNVTVLELETIPYDDDPEVSIYKNFKENVGNKKYDFICIDAPFGGGAKKYARIDILDLIPDCLCDDFIILLDDYNRKGEQNTGELIKEKLEECGIAYEFGKYQGKKATCVFTSQSHKFLTTL